MLTHDVFTSILESRRTLIIDGALATELERQGYDLNHPLWSARVLREQGNSIRQIHLDYFLSGADVAITASYQAATRGLTEHFGMTTEEGQNLVRRSVLLAQRARTAAYEYGVDPNRRLLVAGSVGPYGAYLADGSEYRGDYVSSQEELQDFHRPRIQALIDAGADLLALETIPSFSEIQALLALMSAEFPTAVAWLSCTSMSSSHLSDGTPFEDVIRLVHHYENHIIGIGVNCVPLESVSGTLRYMSDRTKLPLVCYPNSGEVWDATTKTWHSNKSCDTPNDAGQLGEDPSELCHLWVSNGARLIGGCCRTGQSFIRSLNRVLEMDATATDVSDS